MTNTDYTPPCWLPTGHLQTIYPASILTKPPITYRRERVASPDADFIDIDFIDGDITQPLVVLFHGLEGSSDSHYARALMSEVKQRNWSGAVVHFRSCSGSINNAPRLYHSGDAAEINWIIQYLYANKKQTGPIYVAGVSLGANALLLWLNQYQHQAKVINAACAISAPLDLTQSGAALCTGVNRLYTRLFLQTLKPKCLQKLAQYPDLFDKQKMLAAKNLYEFDNVVTAPLHGYKNTEDYWHRASSKHALHDIEQATLVINAKNDPFLPGQYLPNKAAPAVTLRYYEQGGHVGFVDKHAPYHLQWLAQQILHFFDAH